MKTKRTYINVLQGETSDYVELYPYNIVDALEEYGRTVTSEQANDLLSVHSELLSYLGQLYPYYLHDYCTSFRQLASDISKYTIEDVVINILYYAGYYPNEPAYNLNEPHFDIVRMRLTPNNVVYL